MVEHLFANPGGCGDKLTGSTLLDEAQILFNGAVCIRVHFHGL